MSFAFDSCEHAHGVPHVLHAQIQRYPEKIFFAVVHILRLSVCHDGRLFGLITLPPTNTAPVGEYLEDQFPFEGTGCQPPCSWGEGSAFLLTSIVRSLLACTLILWDLITLLLSCASGTQKRSSLARGPRSFLTQCLACKYTLLSVVSSSNELHDAIALSVEA